MSDARKLHVAIVATDGFEYAELIEPLKSLREAGFVVDVLAPNAADLRGWSKGDWAEKVEVDVVLSGANANQYDALVLPGGVINADQLRTDDVALAFIQLFTVAQKPIAAICHGAWALIELDYVRGKTMTSVAALKTDLINAGAQWVDRKVVVDGSFVSSRTPADLPAFNAKFIEVLKSLSTVGDEDTARRVIDARGIDALIHGETPTAKVSRHDLAAARREARGHDARPRKTRAPATPKAETNRKRS